MGPKRAGLQRYTARAADGSDHALSARAGQVVLAVNPGSTCRFARRGGG